MQQKLQETEIQDFIGVMNRPDVLVEKLGYIPGFFCVLYLVLAIAFIYIATIPSILGGSSMLLIAWGGWKYKKSEKERKRQKEITRLILSGKRVKVDLTSCLIQTFEQEKPRRWKYGRRSDMNDRLDEKVFGLEREPLKITYCCIIYTMTLNGKQFLFGSEWIQKSEDTVHMWLDLRKETTLYIDPENESNYYLDIEFMKDS